MTVVTTLYDYLENTYLTDPYATSQAHGAAGLQFTFQINDQKEIGIQTEFNIDNYEKSAAIQTTFSIDNYEKPSGLQYLAEIDDDKPLGVQALMQSFLADGNGVQFAGQISAYLKPNGVQFRSDRFPNSVCPDFGYLEADYLSYPYLGETWCSRPGLQFFAQKLDFEDANGLQYQGIIQDDKPLGVQFFGHIIDFEKPLGFQFDAKVLNYLGVQFLATLYNTTNLRILCEFPSRGLTSSNWTANSTEPGDFSVQNLDTDVVEQYWRSASGVTTGVVLTSDTGLPQGVFMDTLAILEHNLTRSAVVTLYGSNDPTFSIIGTTINLQARVQNMFYIHPVLPNAGWRYWRFEIDDPTNPDGFLKIGTIVFGASQIFQGEDIVDEIEFELRDFAATVETEGYTRVSNSRSQKRRLRLDFKSLDFSMQNFRTLRALFQEYRTTHKCLWIPTPDGS